MWPSRTTLNQGVAMKKLFLLFAAVTLAFTCGFGKANAADGKVYELKIQTSLATSSIFFKTLERTKKNIETLSQGQIKVELLADGAIVKGMQVFDSVSEGLITGGMSWAHWASGKHPAAFLFSAPIGGLGLGMDQLGHMSWLFEGDGCKLLNEYYQQVLKFDIISWPVLPMGPETFGWFNEKYTTVAEMNKLTFRAPPGVPSEPFKLMGMPVVSMPGVDIIPAAQRKAIDASEWITPGEDLAMGFPDVWKHYYLEGLHQAISIGDVYINKKWFEALPQHLQDVINICMKATVTDQLLNGVMVNAQALEKMVREKGVIIESTPDDYYKAFMDACRQVVEKYNKDPFFQKVYGSILAWSKTTVPYQYRSNRVFTKMAETAMKEGVITDYK